MMDQIHIGYTSWNNPEESTVPATNSVAGVPTGKIELPEYIAPENRNADFVEKDGFVSMEAEHFTRKTDGEKASWAVIPELGHTLSAITTLPVTESPEGLVLEYDFELETTGFARVTLRFSPTLNFNDTGLRYAVSIDGREEQVININGDYKGDLGQWQAQHRIDSETVHNVKKAGKHTLRIRPLDPGLVLQKIFVNMGGMRKSYLGAPETIR